MFEEIKASGDSTMKPWCFCHWGNIKTLSQQECALFLYELSAGWWTKTICMETSLSTRLVMLLQECGRKEACQEGRSPCPWSLSTEGVHCFSRYSQDFWVKGQASLSCTYPMFFFLILLYLLFNLAECGTLICVFILSGKVSSDAVGTSQTLLQKS